MESTNQYFQAVDFVIFGAILLVSTGIGIFFAYKDRRDQSTVNYYFGRKNVSPIVVGFSLSVSFISAITVVGIPVEVYLFGLVYAWSIIALLVAVIAATVYYIPLYQRLQLRSVFEYLDQRFHPRIRSLASTMSVLQSLFYMGITIYLPSLALGAVTPLKLEWTIAITSVICTFYTTIGGMKAVLWTDVFQALIMISGMLAVFIQYLLNFGGIQSIMEATERGQRNNIFTAIEGDPRIRSTIWTIAIGMGIARCAPFCSNQMMVQRYLSCKSVRSSRIAVCFQWIPSSIMILLSTANGLVLYTYYEGCDPRLSGVIEKNDQAMPRLALEIFQDIPGMAGMFVSAAFCGTLSSISSGINALSALALEDFISPCFPTMSEYKRITCSKILSILFGGLIMGIAYLVSQISSNVVQINAIAGAVSAPILSVFTMGMFMPWINKWGALFGLLSGIGCGSWVAIASYFHATYPKFRETLSVTVDNCSSPIIPYNETGTIPYDVSEEFTFSTQMTTTVTTEDYGDVIQYTLYSMSPYLYGVFGMLISIVVGHIASLITGFNKISEADPALFVPLIDCKLLRFGIPKYSPGDKESLKEDRYLSLKNGNIETYTKDNPPKYEKEIPLDHDVTVF